MAITETALTVLGTATPWVFASGSSNPGPLNTYVPFGSGYNDGSASAGGVVSNSSFKFGHNHTHAGETGPTQLAVLAGQMVSLLYVSGTVATQGGGAGNSGPAGTPVVNGASTPLAPGESDTYSLPTNVIPGASGINASCVVNTVTTAVTYVSGDLFDKKWTGSKLWIGNTGYVIASVASPISLTLATSAGTQNGVNAFVWGAQTSIGGIVGAFTDSSGNIVSTFDWASFKGITPPAAFVLTSVAAGAQEGQYSGTITGGASNAFVGYWFTVAGFANAANNGTFLCIASTATVLTLSNMNVAAETHAGTAQQLSYITIKVPTGATFLNLGINDTELWDNTGSFSLTAIQFDVGDFSGDETFFPRGPVGVAGPAFLGDGYRNTVFVAPGFLPVDVFRGQLFPAGQG